MSKKTKLLVRREVSGMATGLGGTLIGDSKSPQPTVLLN